MSGLCFYVEHDVSYRVVIHPMAAPITIDYYTDICCVWAYFSEARLVEVKQAFGEQIKLRHHFISLFGNNRVRIAEGWEEGEGGYAGYSAHVRELAINFPHVEVHPDIWTRNAPASSLPAHLVLKAVQLLEERGEISDHPEYGVRTPFEELIWRLRLAFFRDLECVSERQVLQRHLQGLGISFSSIEPLLDNGEAFAALSLDIDEQHQKMVEGSPTLLLNEGRQRLYGNVGYRAIAANIEELLERKIDIPAWC